MTSQEKEQNLELVKMLGELRNAFAGAVTCLDEYLNFLGALEEKPDMAKIEWQSTEGPSGTYEKAAKQEGPQYAALLQRLNDHKGKMTVDDFFLWLFVDGETIGRKPRKK